MTEIYCFYRIANLYSCELSQLYDMFKYQVHLQHQS